MGSQTELYLAHILELLFVVHTERVPSSKSHVTILEVDREENLDA